MLQTPLVQKLLNISLQQTQMVTTIYRYTRAMHRKIALTRLSSKDNRVF